MSDKVKNGIKFTVFLILGCALLYYSFQKQDVDLDEIWVVVKSSNYWWFLLALIFTFLSHWIRAIRWKLQLAPLGHKVKSSNAFMSLMIGYLMNIVIPRGGEIARAGFMSRYEKVPFQTLIGTIVFERLIDVFMLGSLVLLALFFQFDVIVGYFNQSNVSSDGGSKLLIYLGIAGVLGIGLLFSLLKFNLIPNKILIKVKEVFKGFKEGMLSFIKMKTKGVFLLYTILIWGNYFLMFYLCFFGLEVTSIVTPIQGLTAFVFGSFGVVLPSPGGIGTYQFFVIEALTLYGIPGLYSLSLSNIIFFSQTFFNVILGGLSFILLPILNQNITTK